MNDIGMRDMGGEQTGTTAASRAPGPRGVPFFGSVFSGWSDPLGLFLESRARYGDVVRFKFGPFEYYLVNDPDVVRHVLVDNAKGYTKSRNYLGLKVVLGEGLLTSEGDHWRRQRKLTQPAFHRDKLAGFADQMSMATRAMLTRWEAEGNQQPFCIHEEMMRLTFRIVGLTLFSSDVDSQASEVGRALDVAMHWANDYAESMIRIPPSIPTPANLRFRKAKKTLDAIVFSLIAERRGSAQKSGDFGGDLLGMLMAATEEPDGSSGARAGMEPAWVFERQAIAADTLGGFPIAAGSIVAICPYVMQRHPGHWDNPEGFDPERFRPERAEKRARYAYLPFGGGHRTCVGNHFAMMEAQLLLAMIVREHRLELVPSHKVVLDPVITLRPKTGIKVMRRPAVPASASGSAASASSGCPAPRTPSAPRAALS